MIGKKYADGISEYYKPISVEEISGPAEEILRFLSERKNPMFEAHDLAINYVYWKFKYDGRSERKLKGIFKNSLKGDKERSYNSNKAVKDFKAYCFSLRSVLYCNFLHDGQFIQSAFSCSFLEGLFLVYFFNESQNFLILSLISPNLFAPISTVSYTHLTLPTKRIV